VKKLSPKSLAAEQIKNSCTRVEVGSIKRAHLFAYHYGMRHSKRNYFNKRGHFFDQKQQLCARGLHIFSDVALNAPRAAYILDLFTCKGRKKSLAI
jgi:hypothetical protein